jgi:hypothetical protein
VIVPDAHMRVGDFSAFLPSTSGSPSGSSFILGAPYVKTCDESVTQCKHLVRLYTAARLSCQDCEEMSFGWPWKNGTPERGVQSC